MKQEVCKKGQGGNNENVWGFGSARREEEEYRCARLCSTDVETSPVSVEHKRKCAGRQATLTLTRV